MGCDVQLGNYVGHGHGGGGPRTVMTSPNKIIFFSPETPPGTTRSAPFVVSPGRVILIEAYNLLQYHFIKVNRVVVSNYTPARGSSCDPCAVANALGQNGFVTFRAPMTLGNGYQCWRFTNDPDNDCRGGMRLQMLIALPGTYELELEETSMLGNLQVEGIEWDARLTPGLPEIYHAGTCPFCELN